jgi:hypothetical protein
MAQFNVDNNEMKITIDELTSMFYGEYFIKSCDEDNNMVFAKVVIADFLLNNAKSATA